MKIVVLAGGTSTERSVSITSGTMVCKALREKNHQAVLVDVFCGIDVKGNLEDVFAEGGVRYRQSSRIYAQL